LRDKIENLIRNLKARNIDACYFESAEQCKDRLLELIPNYCSVGIGNSQTLIKMNISKLLLERGNIVFDKTMARDKREVTEMKKKSLLTDYYISSTNAISVQGHLVNIDHSGNRVAAMMYGPEQVVVIVGINKIVDSLDDAIKRARNTAAPANAKRAGLNPPCVSVGECVDCRSSDRACNNMVIIEGQNVGDRMKVFIINENLGY
jgi:L-lactate utilization protein LutB